MAKEIDFTNTKWRKPTEPGGNCLWCKFGKLDFCNSPIRLKCTNKYSKNFGKSTKFPHKKTCKEWRYKF